MRSAKLTVLAALAVLALPCAAPAGASSSAGAKASAKSWHGVSYRRVFRHAGTRIAYRRVTPPKKHKSGRIAERRVPPKKKPPPKTKGHH